MHVIKVPLDMDKRFYSVCLVQRKQSRHTRLTEVSDVTECVGELGRK